MERKVQRQQARIACCTMVTHGYTELMKIWLEYNILIGIEHFYIYDNAPLEYSRLYHDLQDYIDEGTITVVPWHPETWTGFKFHSTDWVQHQIWSQNDCIQRYGHHHEWMGIFDVDEFPILLQPNVTLTNLLERVPQKYCSLRMKNCMTSTKNRINATLVEDPSKLLAFFQQDSVNRTNCVTRLKHFVRPSRVYYFCIHWLSRTTHCSQSYVADDLHEVRINHYKPIYPRPSLVRKIRH